MKQQGAATTESMFEPFAQGWTQALASIQALGSGGKGDGHGPSWQIPQISFDPEQLQSLQQR